MKVHSKSWGVRFGMIAIICVLMAAMTSPVAANSKIADLEQKVADMTLLQHQLVDRIEQAKALREKFRHQQETYLDEINTFCQSHRIKSLSEAENHLRTHYDIRLVGMLTDYLDQIEAKITFFQTGLDKLAYLQQSASDDIKMIKALNDLEIDALTTQISLIINQYISDAHVIQLDDIKPDSIAPHKVWKLVVASK